MPTNIFAIMLWHSLFWKALSSFFVLLISQYSRASSSVFSHVRRRFNWRAGNLHTEDDHVEDSDLYCLCGFPAKLRVSRSSKNPYRLFYNCSKKIRSDQCRFFRWSDEISNSFAKHWDERALLQCECLRLQRGLDFVQSRRQLERNNHERETTELRSQLLALQSELNEINVMIKRVEESEEMPPLEESCSVDDQQDDTALSVIVGAVRMQVRT